ncbi:MAG: guanylate kinase [Deltaproteobacteria bacterium]|jgi:guanylate kinase|nr:guanylate kinase [Deltaproteobacteria bacterium]
MADCSRIGTALVICAPSGTGKTTLVKRLLEKYAGLSFSVSCTTRDPRPGEVEGKDYFFLDRSAFMSRIEDEFYFAEWAEVHGNYYGTPLEQTRDILASGRDLLFDVDVQGAKQLKQSLPEACFVFVLPPSKAELERRLRNRKTDSEADIILRLLNSSNEMTEADWFDFWVVNDNMEKAFADLCDVYQASRLIPARRRGFLRQLLDEF